MWKPLPISVSPLLRKILSIVLVVFMTDFSFGALSGSTVFEVETGGADTNGGGFVTGSGGTDWSQQSAAHVTFNGTSITATTAGTGATITLSGYTVLAGDVGNLLNISGGVNFTVGVYQIVSVSAGVGGTWTLDRNATTGAGTAMTGAMGGAYLTIGQAITEQTLDQQIIYVKGGTYSITTGLSQSNTPSFDKQQRLIGYSTVRGDKGRPIVQTSSAITMLTIAGGGGYSIENMEFNGTGTATGGISITASYQTSVSNSNIHDIAGIGVSFSGVGGGIFSSQVSTCTGGGISTGSSNTQTVEGNNVYGNTGYGISLLGGIAAFNIVHDNPGATTDGIQRDGFRDDGTFNNTVYNNGRDGIRLLNYTINNSVVNNIIVNNGGYGINIVASLGSATYIFPGIISNAYYNNTSGNANNFTMGTSDIVLTGSPFTSPPSNFALNNTAGAGASCRAAAYPGAFISGGTGFLDIGALQHQSTGGTGGTKGYPFSQ